MRQSKSPFLVGKPWTKNSRHCSETADGAAAAAENAAENAANARLTMRTRAELTNRLFLFRAKGLADRLVGQNAWATNQFKAIGNRSEDTTYKDLSLIITNAA